MSGARGVWGRLGVTAGLAAAALTMEAVLAPAQDVAATTSGRGTAAVFATRVEGVDATATIRPLAVTILAQTATASAGARRCAIECPVVAPPPEPPTTAPPTDRTKFARPLISIEFDDGWRNAYEVGLPIVESFGFRPTEYVITGYPYAEYMTDAQILDWAARGDIGSHSVTHPDLASLTPAQLESQVGDSDRRLEQLLQRPVNLFATPFCSWNQNVVAAAKRYYTSMRNCAADVNRRSTFDVWGLNAFIVSASTPPAQIQQWINTAKADNAWLILVYHEVRTTCPDEFCITPTNLRAQMQVVANSGVAVRTTAQALAELRSQL